MKSDKQRLTKDLHQLLIKKGFRYFLIEDVGHDNSSMMTSCTVRAMKELPHSFHKSCTGIEDGMITSLIDGHAAHIAIYITLDEEHN